MAERQLHCQGWSTVVPCRIRERSALQKKLNVHPPRSEPRGTRNPSGRERNWHRLHTTDKASISVTAILASTSTTSVPISREDVQHHPIIPMHSGSTRHNTNPCSCGTSTRHKVWHHFQHICHNVFCHVLKCTLVTIVQIFRFYHVHSWKHV